MTFAAAAYVFVCCFIDDTLRRDDFHAAIFIAAADAADAAFRCRIRHTPEAFRLPSHACAAAAAMAPRAEKCHATLRHA